MNAEQSMTDVLRGHWSASTHSDSKPFVDKCDGCGEVIFSWDDPTVRDGHEHLAAHQAKALAAAGWVKPRTITTAAELDALPESSVVLDLSGYPWSKRREGWVSFDGSDSESPITVLWQDKEGPSVTLLHEGQA